MCEEIVAVDENPIAGDDDGYVRSTPLRLLAGFGVLVVAVTVRCFTPVTGRVLITLGTHLPALRVVDLLTGPLALLGVAIVASAPGLSPVRRGAGSAALAVAVAWPALKLGDMGPVVLSLTRSHGVHTHDALLVPWLAVGVSLLDPRRFAGYAVPMPLPIVVGDVTPRRAEATLRAA